MSYYSLLPSFNLDVWMLGWLFLVLVTILTFEKWFDSNLLLRTKFQIQEPSQTEEPGAWLKSSMLMYLFNKFCGEKWCTCPAVNNQLFSI